jgi:hypothetical protein
MLNPSFDPDLTKNLILAVDGQSDSFTPENDHVWSVSVGNSEQSAFSLQTTFNLRAKLMRLFPVFTIEGKRITSTADFNQPPCITHACPGFIQIQCAPAAGLSVTFDLLMLTSDTLTGAVHCSGGQGAPESITLEMAAVLNPMQEGVATKPERKGTLKILSGQTGHLYPVLFMSGGPDLTNSPYPALSKTIQPAAQENLVLKWALVAGKSKADSLERARKAITHPLTQTAVEKVISQSQKTIHIKTGNPGWDTTFALSQVHLANHRIAQSKNPSSLGFLRTRLPDDPIPADSQNTNTDAITLLETLYLAKALLSIEPELLKQMVLHFLSKQGKKGNIPHSFSSTMLEKPYQELPLLAHLSLQIYNATRDQAFLKKVFPGLLKFLNAWQDNAPRKSDTLPVIESVQQLQLDSGLFPFDIWNDSGWGQAIQTVNTPALAALLYRETTSLAEIAGILKAKSIQRKLKKEAKKWQTQLHALWNPYRGRYDYQDQANQEVPTAVKIFNGKAQKSININHCFKTAQRFLIRLNAAEERTRVCTLTIIGKDARGESLQETTQPRDILWVLGRAFITSQNLYSKLESLHITGLTQNDQVLIKTTDLSQGDISCLLPLWAGATTEKQVNAILKHHLHPQDERLAYGIPEALKPFKNLPKDLPNPVNLLWNMLILEGLVKNHRQKEAASVFEACMTAVQHGLRSYEGFYPRYDSENGRPTGKRNVITSIPPIEIFLEICGIKLHTPQRLAVWGQNPFPWPVEVQWQGLTIRREGPQTDITFPNGQHIQRESEAAVLLEQE